MGKYRDIFCLVVNVTVVPEKWWLPVACLFQQVKDIFNSPLPKPRWSSFDFHGCLPACNSCIVKEQQREGENSDKPYYSAAQGTKAVYLADNESEHRLTQPAPAVAYSWYWWQALSLGVIHRWEIWYVWLPVSLCWVGLANITASQFKQGLGWQMLQPDTHCSLQPTKPTASQKLHGSGLSIFTIVTWKCWSVLVVLMTPAAMKLTMASFRQAGNGFTLRARSEISEWANTNCCKRKWALFRQRRQ